MEEIKIFKDRDMNIQRQLGSGSFATVYLANCDEPEVTNPVVMKVMHDSVAISDAARKLFMKEVKLLAGLHHENIVRMYEICVKPLAIILEYVVFDFKPFKKDLKVNIVDEVLTEIAQSQDDGYDYLIPAIATEITKGLSHLHERDIAHRDLKPANILISNQHYSALQDKQQMNRIKAVRPVVCKLADFGESRSRLLQTNGLNDPNTRDIFRGTIPFMAPEILLPGERIVQGKKLSLGDLKKVDVWALGLVFYCLINPGVSYPYERDGATDLPDILRMLQQRQRPSSNPQYQTRQSTVWSRVKVAFEVCANRDPSERPNASDVLAVLSAPRGPGLVANESPLRRSSAGKRHVGAAVQMRGNPAHMAAVQWYAGEQGEAALKYVFDGFTSIADSEVKMSRKTDSHVDQDVTLSFKSHGQEWHVTFLYDFPRSNASLTTSGGDCISIGGDTVETAIRAIINRISSIDTRGNAEPKMAVQWYLGEEGESALKYIFDELRSIADGEVKMSRKTDTQDLTLSFEHEGNEWQVKFPFNFPRSNASLSTNGELCAMVGGDTMENAVDAIITRISSPAHHMRGTPAHVPSVQWYLGEEGEAALKYIFDELGSIADGEVKMSRKTDTQDLTLRFQCQGQDWQVKFPSNFPRSNASLSINGEIRAMIGGDTVENAVSAMINRISLASACGNAAR